MPEVVAIGKGIATFFFQNKIGQVIGTIGLNILASKLFAPRIDNSIGLSGLSVSGAATLQHRTGIFGESVMGGVLVYHGSEGTEREYYWRDTAMVSHLCDDLVEVRIGDQVIPKADIAWTAGTGSSDGTGTGNVSSSAFEGNDSPATVGLRLFYYLGDEDQPVCGPLNTAFTDIDTTDRGRGIAHLVLAALYNEQTELIWQKYQPEDITAVWRGAPIYDRRRDALNADPNFRTTEKPVGGGLKWFDTRLQASAPFAGADSVSVGTDEVTVTDNDTDSQDFFSERIPIDSSKRYGARVTGRQTGDRTAYLGVVFYDSNGDYIEGTGSGATGWGSLGTYHYFGRVNQAFPGTDTQYTISFGPGGTATIPAGAVEMALLGLLTWNGTNETAATISDAAIYENPVGMSSSHDPDDADTWQWSDNPVMCGAHYITQVLGDSADNINWPLAIEQAQACDESVEIDAASPPTTEKRFTCNGAWSEGDTHKANLEAIASAMNGNISKPGALWNIRAGVWDAPTVTLAVADLIGAVKVNDDKPERDRFNVLRGYFIDPDRNYEPMEFPHVTRASYVTRDNGRELEAELKLPMTNSGTMAQRIAYQLLDQNAEMTTVELNTWLAATQLDIGERFNFDFPEKGWTDGDNQVPYSENFANAAWSKERLTVTADDAVTPWGTQTGDRIVHDGTAGSCVLYDSFTGTAGAIVSTQVLLKKDVGDWAVVAVFGPAGVNRGRAYFNLETGEKGSTTENNWTVLDSNIRPAGDGWYWCDITVQTDTDSTFFAMYGLAEGDADLTLPASSGQALWATAGHISERRTIGRYIRTDGAAVTTSPKVLRVIQMDENADGSFRIIAQADDSEIYDDPLPGEYGTATAASVTSPTDVVPAPSGLTATAVPNGIRLDWTNPPEATYDKIKVYESATNGWTDSPGPSEIACLDADTLLVPHDAGEAYYYWIRAIRLPDLESLRNPNSDTSTVFATSGSGGGQPASPITPIGASISDVATDPDDAEAAYRIDSDGDVYERIGTSGSWSSVGTWLDSGSASDYEAKVSKDSGDDTTSGAALDTWHGLGTDRDFVMTETVVAGLGLTGVFTVTWRDATTLEQLGSASMELTADVESGA